jgi:hypothetical protein
MRPRPDTSGGQFDVLVPDRRRDIADCKIARLQLCRIEPDADLALSEARRADVANPIDGLEPSLGDFVDESDFFDKRRISKHRHHHDGVIRHRELIHDWGLGLIRKIRPRQIDLVAHVGRRGVNVATEAEFDHRDPLSFETVGIHILDPGNSRELLFDDILTS